MATEDEIYAGLTTIFHDVLLRDDLVLTPTLSADQVEGWDSFRMIDIILAELHRPGPFDFPRSFG